MRIGELARRSGVPLPTVKFYLRIGLLPTGDSTAANQAEYGDWHLRRLRLLLAFLDVGGMSVAGARAVLAAVDDTDVPLRELLRLVRNASPSSRLRGLAGAEDRMLRDRLLAATAAGGRDASADRSWDRVTDACAAARQLDVAELEATLGEYAEAANRSADGDVAAIRAFAARVGDRVRPTEMREAVVLVAVLGAALQEALGDLARQDRLPGAVAGVWPEPAGG
ncbi:MerR family transcriptional regulator [Mangrovihabitans endophyticus]|uniref:MerR family transcriptional regulator n=1 Tax=Mangrovihabitans endophyticus TaxID=1751298 RepID=A0A8J3FM38_9ACTN|nr:MerR family transcriptional regulator [Mangrovihabitans endophyticus]GGK76458.1 MerR family transcriptional regulator [Mangrovihabitans endophyticus]